MTLSGFLARAQVSFGIAAGYEHLNLSSYPKPFPAGGPAGSLLLKIPLTPRVEIDMALTVARCDASIKDSIYDYGDPRGGPPTPPVLISSITRVNAVHILLPFHFCYTIPFKNFTIGAGLGIFLGWMDNNATTYGDFLIKSSGYSFLGTIRWRRHLLLMGEFRPVFKSSGGNYNDVYGRYYSFEPKDDWSLKIGYEFGKRTRKK